ncbi:MAG TPA: AIPR family protein [Planctomycetota bacterium]
MAITEQMVEQTYSDMKSTYGGVKQDYFGVVYLEKEFGIARAHAAVQVAFGNNDYGIDGFHIDLQRRNLYLFQFKFSASYQLFKDSFKRLTKDGMRRIFGNPTQDQQQNQMLLQLYAALHENKAAIDQVCIHFVFTGNPEDAERSQVLDKLREDLESQMHLLNEFFGRRVPMLFRFVSAATHKTAAVSRQTVTHVYPLRFTSTVERTGPNGEVMLIGFVPLADLHSIHKDMGQRFFERNIRSSLSEEEAPNRAIKKALRSIVLEAANSPTEFAFHHNGITLFAQKLEPDEGKFRIVEPRLLNGAQTVTTFGHFVDECRTDSRFDANIARLNEIAVLAKVITQADDKFVISVTINNNRQNPIMPWNLRANDEIQLAIQDKFRDDLGIYYERQENAFENLSNEELQELEISEYKAVQIKRLAQTFLASDGAVDKMSRLTEVFENDNYYEDVFNDARMGADARKILLCYKIQFRLRRCIQEIIDKGERKYAYMYRARNLLWALLCQGMMNDKLLEGYCDLYGKRLVIEADFTNCLAEISSTRVRPIIAEAIKVEPYDQKVLDESYDFLRTRAFYDRCMEIAYKRWKWVQKRLK